MIAHNVYIVVADGKRAHIYRNSGNVQAPHLELVTGFDQKNPPSHEQGTDHAGSVHSGPGGIRSHVSESDYHDAQEHDFAKHIVKLVTELVHSAKIEALIWVAPPRMLASLRADMTHELKAITKREIDKDLTKHSPQDIVKLIAG
jgi:protein required for attachment to host cells